MIDLHLSAFAPRWRFLYVVRIDAYEPPQSFFRKSKNRLCHAKGIAEPVQSVSAETAPFGQFALHSNMDFYDGS